MKNVDVKLQGEGLLAGQPMPEYDHVLKSVLKRRFLIPPFSTWNTREGMWQNRKRQWIELGIQSEIGREDVEVYDGIKAMEYCSAASMTQVSIFDPVVTELCYNWFCPAGGQIVDPFAGGSVRGIVASVLGFQYWGCDLSKKQIKANREQLNSQTTGKYEPVWVVGDSTVMLETAPKADVIMACPPYGNLEVYSDDPRDISRYEYADFLEAYREIIKAACDRLKNNRFAVFVVGNFRDRKSGTMHDLVGDTVRAFKRAGLAYYNEAVILNPCGSAPVRANNTFIKGGRKLVKLHQNVLIFAKGQPDFDIEER